MAPGGNFKPALDMNGVQGLTGNRDGACRPIAISLQSIARLSPAALEVLSILAYNQPATADALAELRGSPCGAALATLVRYRLARLDRPQMDAGKPVYTTTDRFLKLFGMEGLDSLPRSEELERI